MPALWTALPHGSAYRALVPFPGSPPPFGEDRQPPLSSCGLYCASELDHSLVDQDVGEIRPRFLSIIICVLVGKPPDDCIQLLPQVFERVARPRDRRLGHPHAKCADLITKLQRRQWPWTRPRDGLQAEGVLHAWRVLVR
jgi:hypothetical protein